MKRCQHYIFNVLVAGLCFCSCISHGQRAFDQEKVNRSVDAFIDSLNKISTDTIIEIRTNRDYLKVGDSFQRPNSAWTFIYYKNFYKFQNENIYSHQYLGIRFDSSGTTLPMSDGKWLILFSLVHDYWDTIKTEKILESNKIYHGIQVASWSFEKSSVEVVIHFGDRKEKIVVLKDRFLPGLNEFYMTNILTKTFLFFTLIEKYDNVIERANLSQEINKKNIR